MLNKNSIYATILLTGVWVMFRENASYFTVVSGLMISACCVYVCARFLPFPEAFRLNYFRLAVYFFYLIWQVYVAGVATIKLILTGVRVEIVTINTSLTNRFLRTILVNSITLVPGSVSLDITGETITVLWLIGEKADEEYIRSSGEIIAGKLERMLIKAQK